MSIDYDYLHDKETRVTDTKTGGQKGTKLTQIGALDPIAQIELGRIAGMGASKYESFNYLKGFDWSLAFNAMMRHANLFWAGEDRDYCTLEAHADRVRVHDYVPGECNGSGLPHMAHASWMAQAILSFYLRDIGTDDRPPRLEEVELDEPRPTPRLDALMRHGQTQCLRVDCPVCRCDLSDLPF